ncbi:MAG TPA: carbohydrate kinase family protein, partial [bacterium]|nr:carbohydrate kinase family protein [bacterium]
MPGTDPDIIVAGHICLDLIPGFRESADALDSLFIPGKLTEVGPVVISTGGAVSNTGIAIHRLGIPTTLAGKIGDDLFGETVLNVLRANAGTLAEGMVIEEGASTSYTLVLNPPGVDRIFLHNPGTNDTFVAADVDTEVCRQVKIFHFGYPSLMRKMYENAGVEFIELMRTVKATGVTTSIDMSYPDPETDAGRADWPRIFQEALPFVDIFLPSLDETMFLLQHPRYENLDSEMEVSIELLQDVSSR